MASTGSCNVPARSDTQLIEFQDWILRVRPSGERPARLLLLIHGWTGDENSMWVFVRRFPARYWIIAPRAPYTTQPTGYSWRASSPSTGAPPNLEDLKPAAQDLVRLADTFAVEHGIEAREFDAIGFSQGAAVANALALLYPRRLGRVGILAGFVPANAETLLQAHRLEGRQFFVAHGTQDDRVSIEAARRSIELLEGSGAKLTYCEAEVGHKVSADCLRALETFFA